MAEDVIGKLIVVEALDHSIIDRLKNNIVFPLAFFASQRENNSFRCPQFPLTSHNF